MEKRALIGQEMRNISKIANLLTHVYFIADFERRHDQLKPGQRVSRKANRVFALRFTTKEGPFEGHNRTRRQRRRRRGRVFSGGIRARVPGDRELVYLRRGRTGRPRLGGVGGVGARRSPGPFSAHGASLHLSVVTRPPERTHGPFHARQAASSLGG